MATDAGNTVLVSQPLAEIERKVAEHSTRVGEKGSMAHWVESLVLMLHSATCLSSEPEYSSPFPGPHATPVTGSECTDCWG